MRCRVAVEIQVQGQGTLPFSVRVREETRADHERAERATFVSDLVGGRLSRDGFATFTSQLWFLYQALDAGAARLRQDPVVGPFLDPRLDRGAALATDLETLVGSGWQDRIRPLPSTMAHATRIATLADEWPAGYLAHHYLRYLGDLSGGKVLGKAAQRTYGLTDAGVRFYRFEAIPSGREFKDHYRRLLDQAPWSEDERQRILAEVALGFRMSGAMFEELAGAVDAA
ncbi:MAG: biliverdin-producing heme oxygenase [Chloroflexi bacterium]|nr:biliverdin-producing heme oxygenase [Chloroflexota bacterium]